MAQSFEGIVDSKPCKFVVGSNEDKIWIHPFLVALHSRPLHDKIETARLEKSGYKTVTIANVDKSSFVRFAEYIYTGRYTAASHSLVEDVEDDTLSEGGSDTAQESAFEGTLAEEDKADSSIDVPVEEGFWGLSSSAKPKKSSKKGKSTFNSVFHPPSPPQPILKTKDELVDDFRSKSYASQPQLPIAPTVRANEGSEEVYKNVFLSHAELYSFAAKYEIENLRLLALDNLHKTLTAFTLHTERAGDISALLEFAWKVEDPGNDSAVTLQTMVMDYVVCHADVLMKDKRFMRLIKNGGVVAVELMGRLVQRLN